MYAGGCVQPASLSSPSWSGGCTGYTGGAGLFDQASRTNIISSVPSPYLALAWDCYADLHRRVVAVDTSRLQSFDDLF